MSEPIEDYLDQLLLRLHLPPRDTRRLLAETEAHLREAAEEAQRGGATREEAELAAVRRFGSVDQVARSAAQARRLSPGSLIGNVLWGAVAVGGALLAAIGLSGGLAALANAALGPRFVGALPQTYPAATCRSYLALHTSATTCAQAAVLENSQDAVVLRLLAGVIGVLLIVLAGLARRWVPGDRGVATLRDGLVSVVAVGGFAVGAAALLAAAVGLAVRHGSGGVGFYLSGAVASAAAAAVAAVPARRRLGPVRRWAADWLATA